jgi:general secretion pathway protein C
MPMKTRKAFQIISVTIVVIFAVDIVLKIVNSRLQVERPRENPVENVLPDSRETKPYSAYAKIVERNLFKGDSMVPAVEEKADDDMDHPVTDLKLTLKGTIVGNKERSFAVIEDGKLRTQNLYHVNDSITSGVTLSAIYSDRVVINRNGRKELLLMFQEDQGKKAGTPSATVTTEPARTIQRQEIQQAVGDLKSLMRDIRIIPHFTAGKRDGFTVTYVRQGSRLEELGLQKNDIVKEINGTPAEDFRNIFEIFNKYAGENTLVLGVERNSQLMNITYSVE